MSSGSVMKSLWGSKSVAYEQNLPVVLQAASSVAAIRSTSELGSFDEDFCETSFRGVAGVLYVPKEYNVGSFAGARERPNPGMTVDRRYVGLARQ